MALEPQVYRTLVALVENSQHLSRREWLLEQIWGDTHVEEGGLTRNISVLRRVLGEGYIETAAKRGYRFVAETAEMSVGTESPEAYQLYIKGRYQWNQRSEAGLTKATEYFARAIETDPAYARAYLGSPMPTPPSATSVTWRRGTSSRRPTRRRRGHSSSMPP